MKKLITILTVVLITTSVFAQAPQKMSYQAVIRNSGGALVTNQSVGMRVSISTDSAFVLANINYREIYNPNPVTNVNGLVTIEIGGGLPAIGTFANINWASGPYYIKTETDPTGGTSYTISGKSELLSVPYALFAGNVSNYNAGTGISIASNTVTNTAPDQTVAITGTGHTNVTGTYPNFTVNTPNYTGGTGISVAGNTVTNTAPDQTVAIAGTGHTTVAGTYPNFTVNTPNYTGGTGISIVGNTVTNTAPDQTVAITGTGGTIVTGTYPTFNVNTHNYTAGTGISILGDTISNTLPSYYSGQHMQVFTSSSTFTVPAGVTSVIVEITGAGGGCSTTDGNPNHGPGAGGGGGYGKGQVSVVPGQVYNVIVGIGGISAVYPCSGCPGTSGSSSSFAGIVSTGGGGGSLNTGGTGGTSNATIVYGGGTLLSYGYGAGSATGAGGTGVQGLVIIYY